MSMSLYALLALVSILGSSADGAKLLMMPVNVNSHVQMVSRLGVALADEGHTTVMVAPSNARVPVWARDSRMEIWQYKVEEAEPYSNSEANSRLLITAALSESMWKKMQLMFKFSGGMVMSWERDCENMFGDADLMAKVKDAGFDLVILDTAGSTCNSALPYRLKLPVIAFSIFSSSWLYRVPAMPSFVPNMMSDYTDHMTFKERLMNFITDFAGLIMANHTGAPYYIAKYAPNLPSLSLLDIIARPVFWFFLEDISVGYPKPLMPNTAFIGDIMTSPAKPLPREVQDFITSSMHGVVVVSFGSFLDHLPPETVAKLCRAFKQIPYKVIWKLIDADQCSLKDKIMTMKWLPQNDLLSHSNVKLFVTHAGLNSIIETVSHAKPVVAIPFLLDQPYNAQFMVTRGLGDRINLRDLSTEDLVSKIQNVIQNKTIQENVKRQSMILRDKAETPGRRASFWIDHVLQYGDQHLRSGAFELSVPQFFMMDIFLFVLVILVLVIALLFVCAVCSYRCCKRCFCSTPRKEKLKKN